MTSPALERYVREFFAKHGRSPTVTEARVWMLAEIDRLLALVEAATSPDLRFVSFVKDFYDRNGRPPTTEEMTEWMEATGWQPTK